MISPKNRKKKSQLDWLKFRASSCAPLFLGTDGLTDSQTEELNKLSKRHAEWLSESDPKVKSKLELTDKMKRDLDALLDKKEAFEKGDIDLPQGARTYVEKAVDQYVYRYRTSFSSKETDKGNRCEDEGIELGNIYFFKSWKKSDTELKYGLLTGHPDIEDYDDKMIVDCKSSWSKDTFPKLPRFISNSTYEWQGKAYCYMKSMMTGDDWRVFRLFYALVSTPEDLVPEWEDDSLHYADDLDINLRITYVDFFLTDEDIAHMERRLAAAEKYAVKYYNELINKQ